MRGAWKDKPKKVFDLVWEVTVEWRTVEMADKQRHQTRIGRVNSRGQSSAKPFPGVSAGGAAVKASTAVVTCFECRKPGHPARSCPLHTFPSKTSSPPAGGRGNEGHGSSTGRGRPPPPAQQQRPQQQRQPQQRQPQHSQQQQQRFSTHQPGSTPSSGAGKVTGGHLRLLSISATFAVVRFSLVTPNPRARAERPNFCPRTRSRLPLMPRRR